MTKKKTGCQTLSELWNIALDCRVDSPGITGIPNRVYSMVECHNVKNFMTMATMRCWQEMNQISKVEFPPLVQEEHYHHHQRDESTKNTKETK